jgi:hypothetical protein
MPFVRVAKFLIWTILASLGVEDPYQRIRSADVLVLQAGRDAQELRYDCKV